MKKKTGKQEVLSGIHSVFEALKAGKREVYQLFVSQDRTLSRVKSIIAEAEKRNVPVAFKETAFLDKATQFARHQGVAANVSPFSGGNTATVLKKIESGACPGFLLIIESLEDPHNFGALIRTALCAGVDGIMVPKDRAVTPSPSVSRASAGAMEHADICLVTNTVSVIKQLKQKGFWVAGLDAAGETPLFHADLTGNLALVVGGEHRGIRPLVKSQCDFVVSLPQEKGVTSLNASVAGGIAMYEALRQRSGVT
ncbi:MAG TPA: 23S rRNA (guanosine(2251)-2'-O)-methyltransferase RlmB [Desulfobacteraceae bacterium]|nr:23S rRNA (guanosine(2251)-2'-O)-methyltransferase RlmB [Desulfobacteraceae bacterium]